jgi:ATP-dependent RNA helicase HelY
MTVNLVRRYSPDDAHRLVRSSFAQYLSDVPLADQLDAVVGLLTDRGYLAGWRVTASGERLRGIYHDCDLLLAEAVGAGLLGGLDAPSLAAMVSLFTFESRRGAAPGELPTSRLAARAGELEALAKNLREDERVAHVPRTRNLDAGFAALAYEWARGAELRRLIAPAGGPRRRGAANPLSGGDFVRNTKQLVDLLRQLALTEGGSRLGSVAGRAADQLVRGIVASSTPAGPEDEAGGDEARAAVVIRDRPGAVS